jgi:hypothetical protein
MKDAARGAQSSAVEFWRRPANHQQECGNLQWPEPPHLRSPARWRATSFPWSAKRLQIACVDLRSGISYELAHHD